VDAVDLSVMRNVGAIGMSDCLFVLVPAVLIVGVTLWRWWNVKDYPIGVSWGLESPDGRFLASAVTMFGRKFFGPDFSWSRFEVSAADSNRTFFTRDFPDLPGALETEDKVEDIKWTPDSKQVTFFFESREIHTVNIEELPQPEN